jgi:hypothetical protein
MTTSTYGKPIVEADDIVARIDALIPRDGTGRPLAWANRQVPLKILLDSSLEILALRARVAVLEAALKPFAALPLWPDAAGDLASEFIESETDLAPVARNDIRAARAALKEAQP